MKRSYLKTVYAVLLIFLFCYTALVKLLNLQEFRKELANQVLPEWSKPSLAWLIPGSEILVAGLLAFSVSRKIGFYGSTILMALFTGYMGLTYFGFFDRVPCSCGGVLRNMGFGVHLLFNLFFLILSIAGIYMYHSNNNKAVTKSTSQS